MGVEFDDTVADQLMSVARSVARDYRYFAQDHYRCVCDALVDFRGPYRVLIGNAATLESENRSIIIARLEDLAEQVWQAKEQARRERERLHALEVEEGKKRTSPFLVPAVLSHESLPAYYDFSLDVPVAPGEISLPFYVNTRRRFPTVLGSDVVSADPVRLRAYEQYLSHYSSAIENRFRDVDEAWMRFRTRNTFVTLSNIDLFTRISEYFTENAADRVWIGRIAQAFEKANEAHDSLSVFSLSVAVAWSVDDVNHILSDKNLSNKELEQAVRLLLQNRDNTAKVASYVAYVLKGLTEFSTAEHISRVNALLSGIQTSPQASRYMLMGLGGKGLVEKIVLADQLLSQNATHLERSGKSVVTQVQILAQSLKTIFMTGERELADYSPELSKKIARDMVGCISPFQGEVLLSNNNGNAISWLLYDAHLSTSFLTQFGDDFELADRFRTDQSYPLWCTQHPSNLSVLFPAIARKSGLDPATSFMSALKNNPQAALAFFKPGRDGEFARQEYWIQNRSWAHDGFVSILGALDVAVTSEGLRGTKEAGELTSSIIELLANRMQNTSNDNKSLGLADNETNLVVSLNPIAAINIAHIMATYMPAIDRYRKKNSTDKMSNTSKNIDIGFGDIPNMPRFKQEDLEYLIRAVSGTDEGFLALRNGVDNYQNLVYGKITQQYLSNNLDEITTINKTNQSIIGLEGFFIHNIIEGRMYQAGQRDQAIKAWTELGRDILSLGTDAATTFIPLKGGLVIDYLADQGLDVGKEHLDSLLATNEEELRNGVRGLSGGVFNRRESVIIHALFVSGVVDQDEFMDYARQHEEEPGQVDQWFSGGSFPTSETIYNNGLLRDELEDFLKTKNYDMDDLFDTFADEAPEIR
ncbi:hypothetical protein SAMN04489737_0421 [Arcanobacterium phocae]|uniref:DUF6571 domain-containing protein n=1 Tax=Arcanobacterium phocae TaxID=131112 RepID=A0A1H2LB87_9ACTO|nr:DUF6571 family protein [Arcanobacterium phocae]SDU78310.1 hypothetical protein SAMN04489737_0421 [Arcanobacterium phocae]